MFDRVTSTPFKGRKRILGVQCSPLKRVKRSPIHKPSPSHRKGSRESAVAAINRSQYESGLKHILTNHKGRAAHQKLSALQIRREVRGKAPEGLNQKLTWTVQLKQER
jgi:hypothetical protein